jgi:spore germination protein GerM
VRVWISRANALSIASLLLLLGAIAATAPRWTRLLSREAPGEEEEGRRQSREEEAARPVERHINVKLFFQAADRPGLVMEERTIPFFDDLSRQLRVVVEEVVKGSHGGLQPTLAPETRVLELFVNARGVAYVDVSKEAVPAARGSFDEMMGVYSIVNSLAVNFPAVKRVQILVEDRQAETFAGHLDLSRPLSADMTLLAASDLSPVAASPSPR